MRPIWRAAGFAGGLPWFGSRADDSVFAERARPASPAAHGDLSRRDSLAARSGQVNPLYSGLAAARLVFWSWQCGERLGDKRHGGGDHIHGAELFDDGAAAVYLAGIRAASLGRAEGTASRSAGK